MSDNTAAKRLLLAEWEKKRRDLDTLIAALRNELGDLSTDTVSEDVPLAAQAGSTGGLKVTEVVQPGDFYGMSQVSAAREFLVRLKRTALLSEIAGALYRGKAIDSPANETILRNISSTLSRSEEFTNVAKGRWGLSEWYPNRAKKGRKSGEQQKPADDTTEVEK